MLLLLPYVFVFFSKKGWQAKVRVSASAAEPGGQRCGGGSESGEWGGAGGAGVMSVEWWWVNLGIMRADVATNELSGDTTRADATSSKVGSELATSAPALAHACLHVRTAGCGASKQVHHLRTHRSVSRRPQKLG